MLFQLELKLNSKLQGKEINHVVLVCILNFMSNCCFLLLCLVLFSFLSIHSTDSYFSLHGSLLPSDTGIIPGRGYLPSGVLAQLKLQQDEQQQQFSLEGQSYDQVHTENVVDVKPVVKQEIVVEDEDEETIVANGSNESSLTPAKPKKLSAKELKKAAKAEEKKAKMEERIAKQKAEGTFVEKT